MLCFSCFLFHLFTFIYLLHYFPAIILCMPSVALGSEDQNDVLLAAADLGMTTGKYAFFLVSTLFGVSLASSDWFNPVRTGSGQLKAAYESAFVLTVQPAGLGNTYSEQMDRFQMELGREPFLSEVKGYNVSKDSRSKDTYQRPRVVNVRRPLKRLIVSCFSLPD